MEYIHHINVTPTVTRNYEGVRLKKNRVANKIGGKFFILGELSELFRKKKLNLFMNSKYLR